MTDRKLTKKSEDQINEVVELYMEMFKTLSSDEKMRDIVKQGDFSNKDFEWLVKWTEKEPEDRPTMDSSDRQHKLRVRRTIMKAIATISWAHRFMDVFDDDEWLETVSPLLMYQLAYVSALRGGYDSAFIIATGLDLGLNEHLDAQKSPFKAQATVTLLPSHEKAEEFSTEIGKRLTDRLKREVREKGDDV